MFNIVDSKVGDDGDVWDQQQDDVTVFTADAGLGLVEHQGDEGEDPDRHLVLQHEWDLQRNHVEFEEDVLMIVFLQYRLFIANIANISNTVALRFLLFNLLFTLLLD